MLLGLPGASRGPRIGLLLAALLFLEVSCGQQAANGACSLLHAVREHMKTMKHVAMQSRTVHVAGNAPDTTIPVVKGSGSITGYAITNAYIKNLTAEANAADTPVQYVFDNVGDTQGEHGASNRQDTCSFP